MDKDFIIGLHSIIACLENPKRANLELYCTDEAKNEIRKKFNKLDKIKINLVSPDLLQKKAQEYLKQLDFQVDRVPSGAFLVCDKVEFENPTKLYEDLYDKTCRILCLDQVTDVHNAAAIMRTASFYGVTHIVFSQKGNFGFSPSFFRIASGATEYIEVIQTSNLSKVVNSLIEKEVRCIGLSEHSEKPLGEIDQTKHLCLVLGAEDVGISNAVKRLIPEVLALKSQGAIKSLNVSVAAAVALEKCFSKN